MIVFCFFFKRKLFALWILFTLSFLPGLFKFDILFLNILLVLIEIIPIRTNKIFKNRISKLNNPGKVLNVNKIHRANNFLLKKKIITFFIFFL